MLDSLRKELLNLNLSNNLIKLREFAARGLTIQGTTSEEVHQKLIEESKKCAFLADEPKEPSTRNVFYFKTSYTEKELEKRLYTTYSEAKSFIDEKGINTLFLSLGALKWYEDDKSDIAILAPLLLVPVQLERNVLRGETTFELQYNEEAIEPNYTLARKLDVDFGIKLPIFDENNTISEYFCNIEESVKNKKRWEILPNDIRINLFSFLKLMMYHDLDDSNWSENSQPSENFLIKNLLNNFGNLSINNESHAANDKFELDKLPLSNVDHILDADSSQAEAIERVFSNKYLVIKGPPGTGKSQTIANIIASCIKKGKTVLFVSEKLAALEVVKSRLEKNGLGAACLELHSNKANRREILESIRQTLEQKTQQNVRDNGELLRLEESRNNLNDYYSSLLDPIFQSEITPFHAIGEILKIKQIFPEVPFLGAVNVKWSRSDIREREDSIKSACSFVAQNGNPRNSPFFGVDRLQIGLIEEDEIKTEINEVKKLLVEVIESSKNLAHKLNLPHSNNLSEIRQLANTAQLLLNNPGVSGINVELNEREITQNEIKNFFETGQKFHKLRAEYDTILVPNAHKQNFHNVKLVYETKGKSWFRFVYSDFRESKKQLLSVLKTKTSSISEQIELANVLVAKAELVEKADRMKYLAKGIFTEGADWDFENDEKWLNKNLGVEYVFDIKVKRNEGDINQAILGKLDIPKNTFSNETNHLQSKLSVFDSKFNNFLSKLEFDVPFKNQFWGDNTPIFDIEQRIADMLKRFELLNVFCQWNNSKKRLKELGCHKVTEELLKSNSSNTDNVYASWRYSIMTTLLDEALTTRPILNRLDLSNQVETFKKTDRYLIEDYNRLKIKCDHLGRIPSIDTFGEPMGILRNEFSKQRRHLPLRKLLEQAGEMIVRIKPVFMMSPLSVADFLRPDKIKFDYVIFDEASQVKPVEAFGALLRGNNAVVVGDDKQLPPSNFFGQVIELEEIDDEETSVVSDMESILDLFVTKNAKQTMLQWHYRSKHESLIAVSNKHFYEDKLINLPSAFAQSEELGLQFRYLPETNYAAGKNEKEAEHIIKALLEHSKAFPKPDDCSIGIVAFGTKQKDCIENLLMKIRKQDAAFDRYMGAAENAKEPFFVKNLENVQGDERDIIFVSICYGKNTEGRLFKRFGPINQKGGERRLNVLFTRARLKCVLFSNFTAGDLSIEESDAKGLRIFKAFLDYAQNRRFNMSERTHKPTDSPFEDSVKAVLEKEGYEVHPQIGSAGYFVDLAIPHPEQKGRYLLGIECDGATYHSSKSARERDRLRQGVLEGLGWNIYRIWSTDWFRQPTLELKKLLDYIAELKSGIVRKEVKETPSVSQPILEIKNDNANDWKKKYQQAHLNMFGISNDLHLVEDSKLINIVSQLLMVEAPVHQDYVKTLITQQLGIKKIGSRIEQKFNELFILGQRKGEWINRDKFIWRHNQKIEKVRDRRHLTEKLRQIEWVSPEEIQLTLKEIVGQAGSIDKIELIKAVIQTLNGGIRLTEGIRYIVEKEVDQLVLGRAFVISDNIVRANK